ncbi:MAG: helix-turn-helix transcriptional regulator, partial [Pseudomonadota bacterium]
MLEVTDLPTDMSADRQSALDTLLPHIAKAVEIGHPRSDPGLVQIGLLTAMERLRIGLAVLDRHGGVVAANEEFRRQSEAIGAMRIDPSGRLHLRAEAHRAALSEALGQTADAHSVPQALSQDALIAYGKEEDTVLCIKIAPLIRSDGFGKTGVDGVLVYSVDSSKPLSFDAAAISQAFGLTGTEELLATLLADGMTNAQIAERRNRSVATINVQVKSLLAKTNSANRTQLVRLMTNFGSGLWALDPVSP